MGCQDTDLLEHSESSIQRGEWYLVVDLAMQLGGRPWPVRSGELTDKMQSSGGETHIMLPETPLHLTFD